MKNLPYAPNKVREWLKAGGWQPPPAGHFANDTQDPHWENWIHKANNLSMGFRIKFHEGASYNFWASCFVDPDFDDLVKAKSFKAFQAKLVTFVLIQDSGDV